MPTIPIHFRNQNEKIEYTSKNKQASNDGLILPVEVLVTIFSFLNSKNLSRLALVCRSWKWISEDNRLWKLHYERENLAALEKIDLKNYYISHSEKSFCWRAKTKMHERQHFTFEKFAVLDLYQDWIACGSHQGDIWGSNLKDSYSYLKTHSSLIGLKIIKEGLVCCAWSQKICLWNLFKKKLSNLHSTTSLFTHLLNKDSKIVTALKNGSIEIIDINASPRATTIFSGHTQEIIQLLVKNEKLISRSQDTTIRVWNLSSGLCNFTIQLGGFGSCTCMQMNDRFVLTGHAAGKIRLWNASTGKIVKTVNMPEKNIKSLHLVKDVIFSLHKNGQLYQKHLHSKELAQKSIPYGLQLFMQPIGNYLLTNGPDNTLGVWDIQSKQWLKTFYAHSQPIQSIECTSSFIVSCDNKDNLVVWSLL